MPGGLLLLAASCATTAAHAKPPLQTVPRVEIGRYLGTWYEIARLPNSFQKACFGVTATYSLKKNGDIDVLNRCRKNSFDGELDEARGKAWAVDGTNAKLKVQFFWPFRGDYWVMELGPDYEYAVVGEPDRKYFWVLARSPQIDEATLEGILARARAQGYDLTRLIRTPQKS